MKISDLVGILKKILDKDGDLEVVRFDIGEGEEKPILEVEVIENEGTKFVSIF